MNVLANANKELEEAAKAEQQTEKVTNGDENTEKNVSGTEDVNSSPEVSVNTGSEYVHVDVRL